MAQVTLQEMRDRVRQRADQVGTEVVSTTELDYLINVAKRKFDDLLARTFGEDYNATSVTFLTTAQSETYSLSVLTNGSYYKLLALSQQTTNGFNDCKPYNWRERNMLRASNITYDPTQTYRYKITGSYLSLLPVPTQASRMEIAWIPSTTALSATTDAFDDGNGWSQFMVMDCVVAIKDKLEEDSAPAERDRELERMRIVESAPNRDAGEPQTVADIQSQELWVSMRWRGYPK